MGFWFCFFLGGFGVRFFMARTSNPDMICILCRMNVVAKIIVEFLSFSDIITLCGAMRQVCVCGGGRGERRGGGGVSLNVSVIKYSWCDS